MIFVLDMDWCNGAMHFTIHTRSTKNIVLKALKDARVLLPTEHRTVYPLSHETKAFVAFYCVIRTEPY